MTSLARIIVANPHSIDVELLISIYNNLKTSDRALVAPETLRNYLLETFDPSRASLYWLKAKNRRAKHPDRAKQQ